MPDLARPLRRALRTDPPEVCPGFGFDKLVYIGFRLFLLLGQRSGDVSSMLLERARKGRSLANNSVGEHSCPTPPRHSAVRLEATRLWYVRVLESTGRHCSLDCWIASFFCFLFMFPDIPCMKRVYKEKKASFNWSAARNKERFSSRLWTRDEKVMNW